MEELERDLIKIQFLASKSEKQRYSIFTIFNKSKMWKTQHYPKFFDQSANPVQSVIQVQPSLTKIVKDPGNERIRTGPNSDLIFSF